MIKTIKTITDLSKFHVDEPTFNKLNAQDRLTYLIDRFKIGMYITVNVTNTIVKYGKIHGFYESGKHTDLIKNGKAKNYTELPPDCRVHYYSIIYGSNPHTKLPDCNITVDIDGKLESYYPLWINPDYAKIRDNKLESIGI